MNLVMIGPQVTSTPPPPQRKTNAKSQPGNESRHVDIHV